MKKFVIRLIIFFLLAFAIDCILGYFFQYMYANSKGGYTKHHIHITNEVKDDILIFGSSRAIHHYNSQILEDSLGLTCYNCGQDGNGIILFRGWWQIIKKRHHPKVIIYDITPIFDLFAAEDNHKYLSWLKEQYDHKEIKEIFDDIDKTEKYKMTSYMYRNNSQFLQVAADFIHPVFNIKGNGYLPLYGELDTMRIKKNIEVNVINEIDTLKLSYINHFIKETEGIKLIFVASPIWYGQDIKETKVIKDLCEKAGVPFFDFSNNPKYFHNNKLFMDGMHLNSQGADEFTRDLIRIINESKLLN